MKLSDVPASPAYLVFHDAYDKGSMDVYPSQFIAEAEDEAQRRNDRLDASDGAGCGFWKAYEKLPRRKIFKYHPLQSQHVS